MLLNSLTFIIFFFITVVVYYSLPAKWRWICLLSAGVVFYCWFVPAYLLVVVLLIAGNYFSGIWIEKRPEGKKKVPFLLGIFTTLILLISFKYAGFIVDNLFALARVLHLNYPAKVLKIIIPLGISFQSFMGLSYVIEVYRGNIKAEKHFGIFSLYLLFFPIIAAGPIERPQNLLPQFREAHTFDVKRISQGFRLMLWGLFKKMVIADRMAIFVNIVYDNYTAYSGFPLIWATLFYTVQIYCDFSGYTDMARGASKIMGFHLVENFDTPYFSRSVTEFWRRWHMSLSSWLRDYLFTPLSVKYRSMGRMGLNLALLITFVICGIWHEANWTFIVWGFLHGCIMVIERSFTKKTKEFKHKAALLFVNVGKGLLTFILLNLLWIFFRSDDLRSAFYIFSNMFKFDFYSIIGVPIFSSYSFIIGIAFIVVLFFADIVIYRKILLRYIGIPWVNYIFIYTLIILLLVFGSYEKTDFIYTRF